MRGRERLTVDQAESANPRHQQAAATRRQLLDAAREVFEARGYRATTVGGITDRASTAHGTFYLYFRNKEDAFCQVIESVIVDELALAAVVPADRRAPRRHRAGHPQLPGRVPPARRPVAGAARGHAAVGAGAAAVARPAPPVRDAPVRGLRRPAAHRRGPALRRHDGGPRPHGDDGVVGVHPSRPRRTDARLGPRTSRPWSPRRPTSGTGRCSGSFPRTRRPTRRRQRAVRTGPRPEPPPP